MIPNALDQYESEEYNSDTDDSTETYNEKAIEPDKMVLSYCE
jgi:hypothetical protein